MQNIKKIIFSAVFMMVLSAAANTSAQTKEIKFTSAFSPLPTLAAKNCKTDDAYLSEGDDFGKVCPGNGKYKLLISGFGSQINYGAVIPKTDFAVYFFPLETGAAQKFERADLYREKIVGQIEWRLADGVPFAAVIRAQFYKNKGGAKAGKNSAVKVGEFVFVRGLKDFEDLQEDLETAQTAFNPIEQAHKIADEFYERKRK